MGKVVITLTDQDIKEQLYILKIETDIPASEYETSPSMTVANVIKQLIMAQQEGHSKVTLQ